MSNPVRHYDVIIVGAGPAGTACAMALKDAKLSVLLLDKATFPRDKVCGDAIGGRSIKMLYKYAPELVEELRTVERKSFISTTRVFIDNQRPFNLYWKNESYCMKRVDFDALLLKHALKNCSSLTFQSNFKVDEVRRANDKLIVGNKQTETYYSANIVVAADGSQSYLAKQLIQLKMDPNNFSAAVRAYYTNVSGIESNQTEVHIYKENMPGYLWIFPVENNTANVGFGMLSKNISKYQLNLKESLNHTINQHPQLAQRFLHAKQESELQGFGLALGSRSIDWCGDNFLLIGDAASLIDPKSGDGISNAIESGIYASGTIREAHEQHDFSKKFLMHYEVALRNKIGNELLLSTLVLRFGTYFPFLIRFVPFFMRFTFIARLASKF